MRLRFSRVLSSRFDSIKFTAFTEKKPTRIDTYIPDHSNHWNQHKMSAINFLVKRLFKYPLNKLRFQKKIEVIKGVVIYNGLFSCTHVDCRVKQVHYTEHVGNATAFVSSISRDKKFMNYSFYHIIKELNHVFNNTIEMFVIQLIAQGVCPIL